MSKKTAITLVLAGAMALSCTAMFAGCGESYSETFNGALSDESYATTSEAAEEFLANELDGDTTTTTLVGYEKVRDLTAEEIAALSLGDVDAATVTAEEGVILYTATTQSAYAAAPAPHEEQSVIMVSEGTRFYYYAPAAKEGEMISKSYFDSVMAPSNFTNVTAKLDVKLEMDVSYMGESASMVSDVEATIKVTENAAYMTMKSSAKGGGVAQSEKVEYYILRDGAGVDVFVKANGTWEAGYIDGVNSMEDIIASQDSAAFADHSYFEKTSSGFKLTGAKMTLFLEEYYASLGVQQALAKFTEMEMDAEYFVSEGKLAKAVSKVALTMRESGMAISMDVTATGKYSSYGTTSVTVPAEIAALQG